MGKDPTKLQGRVALLNTCVDYPEALTMNRMQIQIEAFHRKFGRTIGETPAIRHPELRANLGRRAS